MISKKHILLNILILFFSASLYAQGSGGIIKGTVLNSKKEPITGANVFVKDTNIGDATDAQGNFKITDLEPGSYTLRITAVGYKKVARTVSLSEGEVVNLNIVLTEFVERLSELVVTGTMRKIYIKDSPVKVDVVSVQRLQQGTISANLMDMISGSVSGISTQLNCGVCGTNAIRINGVEGTNIAVLIDGMPIVGGLASVYGLNGISPMIIDQVEVIKGPSSTLYGTSALGGVINIITKEPANTPTFMTSGYFTSHKEGNLSLAVSPRANHFKSYVSLNLIRNEHYSDHNNDGFDDEANRSAIALFAKGVLSDNNGEKRLSIATKYYNENRTGGVKAFSDNIRGSGSIYGESVYTRRALLMAEYRPAGLDERLHINTALTYHHQDSYYGPSHYDAVQKIVFGQTTWYQPIGENFNLLFGGTLKFKEYSDNTPATVQGPAVNFIPGLFTQLELTAGDFAFLGGLRVDHHSEHGYIPAPRFAIKYSPVPTTTFRVNSGTGFRVVNVFTEDHAALTGSRKVVFTEKLKPERSYSISTSLNQIINFDANPLTITIDGFYTHFSNKIIPDYTQDPNLIVYENLNGYSVSRGVSISVGQNFTSLPVSYNASFTLLDVYVKENNKMRALFYSPNYIGSLGLTYKVLPADATITYSAGLAGPKRMPTTYVKDFGRRRRSPAYTTGNIKITKEFTSVNSPSGVGFEAYFSIENLFNYTQGTPLVNAAHPFSDSFDTIYTWGPISGRIFKIGVRLNLR